MPLSVTWIVIASLIFALFRSIVDARAKERAEKLRILETALRQGEMDAANKEELMEVLTGRRRTPPPAAQRPGQGVGFFMRAFAFVGWAGLCVGSAFLILYVDQPFDEYRVAAVILMCGGFGLVTYPFVLRELQRVQPAARSDHAAQEHRRV